MNKVLVTGATGFIGTQLVQLLLDKQWSVRILTRNTQPTLSAQFDISIADLTVPDSLTHVCENIDTVFHLGGYAHAWEEGDSSFAERHHKINYEGTKNILDAAIRAKVKRFIFFSSVKAVADNKECINENWDELPDSPYGIAKRKAEQLVLSAKATGMHVCILRPALVYGPKWKGNLASMLRTIDRGFFPPLPNTNNNRSLVSVDDICNAAILAATQDLANGKIYFVTDAVPYSTQQLYVLMCNALGKQVPNWSVPMWFFGLLARFGDIGKKITGRRMPFSSDALSKLFGSAHYNSARIQEDLGFKPNYDLKKMLPAIIKQYRSK